jgi:hypothetical protein
VLGWWLPLAWSAVSPFQIEMTGIKLRVPVFIIFFLIG